MIFRINRRSDEYGTKRVQTVPLLPLRDIVVFPHMVAPLFIGREKSIAALEYAMGQEKYVLLCTQKDARRDDPKEAEIYRIGTLGAILQMLRLPDGTVKALIEGKYRAIFRRTGGPAPLRGGGL